MWLRRLAYGCKLLYYGLVLLLLLESLYSFHYIECGCFLVIRSSRAHGHTFWPQTWLD